MSRSLSQITTRNVKAAIKLRGNPSLYRLGMEMAEVMERPPGIGREKNGPDVEPSTCRRAVEMCLAGRKVWRLDYLEAVAWVLDVKVTELIAPPNLARK